MWEVFYSDNLTLPKKKNRIGNELVFGQPEASFWSACLTTGLLCPNKTKL